MNELKQLNEAMDYIEANLFAVIDMKKVSLIAGCSQYHFKRMFTFLAGMPIGEYIRKRKLSSSAERLIKTDIKIIDLALELGYNSPDAFSKAFQQLHGFSPQHIRKEKVSIVSFSPLSFQLTIKGGKDMNVRIEQTIPFNLVGKMKKIHLQHLGVNPEVTEIFEMFKAEDFVYLKTLMNTKPSGILCASVYLGDSYDEGTELDQYVAVATTMDVGRTKWDVLSVNVKSWAVFTTIGDFPHTLQNTWSRIYTEWLPSSNYETVEGPTLLWNESANTSDVNFKSEIWVPVVLKQ